MFAGQSTFIIKYFRIGLLLTQQMFDLAQTFNLSTGLADF